MQLVEVERVDALGGTHQHVLVPRQRVDPGGRARDAQRAAVKHLVRHRYRHTYRVVLVGDDI